MNYAASSIARKFFIVPIILIFCAAAAIGKESNTPSYCAGYYAGFATYSKMLNVPDAERSNLLLSFWYIAQAKRLNISERDKAIQFALGNLAIQEHMRAVIARGGHGDEQILAQLGTCHVNIMKVLPDTKRCFVWERDEWAFDSGKCPTRPSTAQSTETRDLRVVAEHVNKLLASGKFREAIDSLTRVIQKSPHSAILYANRAGAYIKIREYTNAIEDCEIAIELDPKMPNAYGNRAFAFSLMGQFDRSLVDYNKTIELAPLKTSTFDPTLVYEGRGYVRYKLGNRIGACNDWQMACKLGNCRNYIIGKEKGTCN